MRNIAEIDKNFKLNTNIQKDDIKFYDAKDPRLGLRGLMFEDKYCRIPKEIAQNTNEGVKTLYAMTAGGRLRFVTDSEYIVLSCKLPYFAPSVHMTLGGVCGFDLYVDNVFYAMFAPPLDVKDGYESIISFGDRKMREIMIYFPLYSEVSEVVLGLQADAVIEKASDYANKTPVIFYGSSITQGGCVSRGGNSYPAILSRRLNTEYTNLGFSGSARGEQIIGEYIAKLDMSVFVLDYDHNADDPEELNRMHEPFYKIIRKHNPDLPIVIVSRPDYRFSLPEAEERRKVIRTTYENAKAAGDEKVWFVDGETLWDGDDWDSCTVDRCHPNDLGQWRMAETIAPVLQKAIAAAKK